MESDSKTSTAPRVTIDRLSSKKVFSPKLSITFPVPTPEEKASAMS